MVDVEHCRAFLSQPFNQVARERPHIDVGKRECRIHVLAQVLDVGRIGADAEHQHLLAICDRRYRLHGVAERGDENRHFVDIDKPTDNADGNFRLGLVIDNDGFELATVDAAVGIDVFHRPAYRLHLVEAEQGGRSGQWIGHAEFQRVLRLRTGHCAA